VTVLNADVKIPAKISQAIALKAFEYFPAKPYRTKFSGIQFITVGSKLMLQERIIEVYIMCNKHPALQQVENFISNI
jgi:hypothetical protein